MKILIVEDEPRAIERLRAILARQISDISIVGEVGSIEGTLAWLEREPSPDVILMDIDLADGSCFSIFDVVDIDVPIIFCTAYEEYALKAFQTHGIAYLTKPIVEADLKRAFEKLERLQHWSPAAEDEKRTMFRRFGVGAAGYKSRFLIKAGTRLLPISVDDIAAFVADNHGVQAYLFDGRSFYLDYGVAEIEGLVDPDRFFRINRQAVVSGQAVQSMSLTLRGASATITAIADPIMIPRDRVRSFRQWLDR